MDWVTRNFDPHGRTSRLGYWRFSVLIALVYVPVWVATILATEANQPILAALVFAPATLACLLASVMIAIRRAHDRDREAIWVAIFLVLPWMIYAAGNLLLAQPGASSRLFAALIYFAGFGLSLWGLVELGFLRGTRGPNSYGPEPARQ